MTALSRPHFITPALMLALGLSACDSRNLSETFAAIKAIKVDDGADPNAPRDHKQLDGQDLKLVVGTLKALTVEKGGLLAPKGAANGDAKPRRARTRCMDNRKAFPKRRGHGQAPRMGNQSPLGAH